MIIFDYHNLIIASEAIHERHHLVACVRVYELVQKGQRALFLGTSDIEIPEDNAHADRYVLFYDQDYVIHPFQIVNGLDKTNIKEPLDILVQ